MDNQNIKPEHSFNKDNSPAESDKDLNKTGLDNWNDRLDDNLEPEAEADVLADENAENFQDDVNDEATTS